jgi:replication factor C subunit 1
VIKPKKTSTPAKKAAPKPKGEETTSSAYFASNKSKPTSQSTPAKKTASAKGTPNKTTNGATPSTGRRSTRKTGKKSYAEDDDDAVLLADDKTGDDDIFADNFKSRKADDDYEEASSDEDAVIKPKGKRNGVKDESDDDDDLEMAEINGHDGGNDTKSKTAASRKRKSRTDTLDEDEDEEDETPKKKAKKTATRAAPRKPRAQKTPPAEDEETQALIDSIPTVRAPTPPPRDPDSKWNFAKGGGNANAAPMNAGSKEIPEGADDCLLGLTFVFTGVLESLGREEGQNLVKRYGGKVTTGPSKKTNFVVLGNDAGPKKLQTIRDLGIKTINEDGLFELIRRRPEAGGSAVGAEAAAKKRVEAEAKVKKEAEEMERKEEQKKKEAAKIAKIRAQRTGSPSVTAPDVDSRLWVDKYAPDALNQVCGNKAVVEKLQKWLRAWKKNHKFNFKKPGEDGTGSYRAAMLHGPPGVGKTTAAHLIAHLEGYDVVETNASDTRSKKLMETALKGVLDTTSIMGYFAAEGKDVEKKKQNMVLIMDEVDGMSAGDRGGVGALAAVAKKTNIPLILICNERRLPKMKPFDFVTADFGFRRPTTDMIRSRIQTICFREGIKLPLPVLNAMIEGANADIRRIINMLSTIKVNDADKNLSFQDTKDMHKAWEKNIILKPWDIIGKIMRPQMFAESGGGTLNEKTELYFNDHEFSYLMMQENYLKANPSRLGNYGGKERNLKWLELAEGAASSISDGDLVDRMIHGSQQQWSLMPLHAIFSFVRPASYMYGNFNAQVGFAGWLGQNSKQGKLSRFVKEIQGHMRLKTAADRNEIRQQYLPALWDGTVGKLIKEGKEAVDEMIDFMDSYYLTKDDYDAIMELAVGPITMEGDHSVTKKLDTQTKATFTRLYNSRSHPMPFVKASNVQGMSSGGAAKRGKPDLEEAVEDEDEIVEEVADDAEEDDEIDLKKDKYIKAPKKKKAPAKGKAASGGKRKKDADAGSDDEEEDAPKPAKKGRGGGAAGRGRGRGRGRGG